ncbi:MAG: VWA domain-containing protein [Candidatus Heimdallarchaeota archaeon]|nr:VWA domain-containing protein [Candidatus Heimdallarchaeota archaeon]
MTIILNFVSMLRFFGLPISPSETITAQQAYTLLGTTNKFNRLNLHIGLKSAILKRHEDSTIFDTCFNRFFSSTKTDESAIENKLTTEDNQFLARIQRSSNQEDYEIAELLMNDDINEAVQAAMMAFPAQGSGGGIPLTQEISEVQNRLTRALMQTFGLTIPIRGLSPRQRELVSHEVLNIAARLQQFSVQLNQQMNKGLQEKLTLEQPESLDQLDLFLTQDLATVSSTMSNVKEHLLEIGKILASRERRRRKVAKKGKLDFRRTFRKNLKNNGIPLELVQKHKRIEDPELIILNDVSGSTRWIADWFFVISYTAQRVYKKIRVFEFDNTMVEVTTALKRKTIDRAIKERIKVWKSPLRTRRIHSDYQDSLDDFFTLIKHRPLNKRTSILILGDCRDYEGSWTQTPISRPISSELIERMVRSTKNVMILNPESQNLWSAGDSVVKYYQNAGAQVFHVATLTDLLTFVFELKKRAN